MLVPGIKVHGGSIDNVKGCTNKVDNGDKLTLGSDTSILCLHTPWFAASSFIILLFGQAIYIYRTS